MQCVSSEGVSIECVRMNVSEWMCIQWKHSCTHPHIQSRRIYLLHIDSLCIKCMCVEWINVFSWYTLIHIDSHTFTLTHSFETHSLDTHCLSVSRVDVCWANACFHLIHIDSHTFTGYTLPLTRSLSHSFEIHFIPTLTFCVSSAFVSSEWIFSFHTHWLSHIHSHTFIRDAFTWYTLPLCVSSECVPSEWMLSLDTHWPSHIHLIRIDSHTFTLTHSIETHSLVARCLSVSRVHVSRMNECVSSNESLSRLTRYTRIHYMNTECMSAHTHSLDTHCLSVYRVNVCRANECVTNEWMCI